MTAILRDLRQLEAALKLGEISKAEFKTLKDRMLDSIEDAVDVEYIEDTPEQDTQRDQATHDQDNQAPQAKVAPEADLETETISEPKVDPETPPSPEAKAQTQKKRPKKAFRKTPARPAAKTSQASGTSQKRTSETAAQKASEAPKTSKKPLNDTQPSAKKTIRETAPKASETQTIDPVDTGPIMHPSLPEPSEKAQAMSLGSLFGLVLLGLAAALLATVLLAKIIGDMMIAATLSLTVCAALLVSSFKQMEEKDNAQL